MMGREPSVLQALNFYAVGLGNYTVGAPPSTLTQSCGAAINVATGLKSPTIISGANRGPHRFKSRRRRNSGFHRQQ